MGEGEISESIEVIAATVPLKVDSPYKHAASVSSLEIRWAEPDNGGSIITDYNVEWDEGRSNGEFYFLGTTQGYETFTVNEDLSSRFVGGEAYVFRVNAVNAVGEGEFSDATVSIIAAEVPVQPTALTLVS